MKTSWPVTYFKQYPKRTERRTWEVSDKEGKVLFITYDEQEVREQLRVFPDRQAIERTASVLSSQRLDRQIACQGTRGFHYAEIQEERERDLDRQNPAHNPKPVNLEAVMLAGGASMTEILALTARKRLV